MFSAERPHFGTEQPDLRPSNNIHTRATTRRVRAVESGSVHRPPFSIDHSVLPFKHYGPAAHRARVRPAPDRAGGASKSMRFLVAAVRPSFVRISTHPTMIEAE
jgi:hypothetical protein